MFRFSVVSRAGAAASGGTTKTTVGSDFCVPRRFRRRTIILLLLRIGGKTNRAKYYNNGVRPQDVRFFRRTRETYYAQPKSVFELKPWDWRGEG
jgi:hypothetical protein